MSQIIQCTYTEHFYSPHPPSSRCYGASSCGSCDSTPAPSESSPPSTVEKRHEGNLKIHLCFEISLPETSSEQEQRPAGQQLRWAAGKTGKSELPGKFKPKSAGGGRARGSGKWKMRTSDGWLDDCPTWLRDTISICIDSMNYSK